jgi:RNA polymerase sigma factor (sigma-70 family)
MSDTKSAVEGATIPFARIPPSFEAFYVSEFPRMVDIAYALSGSRLAAEDLAQDAMIAAHKQWDRVGTLDRPGAWVRRVVINKAASLYQRRKAELRALARLGPVRGALPHRLDAESAHVWREVRRLPARQSEAVVLFYLGELTVVEVAEAMGCTENTVKAHLHQARQKLAGRLQEGD